MSKAFHIKKYREGDVPMSEFFPYQTKASGKVFMKKFPHIKVTGSKVFMAELCFLLK